MGISEGIMPTPCYDLVLRCTCVGHIYYRLLVEVYLYIDACSYFKVNDLAILALALCTLGGGVAFHRILVNVVEIPAGIWKWVKSPTF